MTIIDPNLIAFVVGLAVALLTPTLTAIVALVILLRRSQSRERNEHEKVEFYRAERKEFLKGE